MGLDMYLHKKVYVQNWEHTPEERRSKVDVSVGGNKIDTKKAKFVIIQAGYWRKANQIHQWFVDNVQEGVDNCSEYYVTPEKLKELLAICEALKELWISGDKNAFQEYAEQVLPTQEGFFFGNQEYGEDYMYDIDETIDMLTDLDFDESDYYYQSSW